MNPERAAMNSNPLGTHAVMIGGSMAGFITARVLTDHFDHVTVVERDHLTVVRQLLGGPPRGTEPAVQPGMAG